MILIERLHNMEQLNFVLPSDLKLEFQILTLKNKSSMARELVKFIRDYIKRQTRKTA